MNNDLHIAAAEYIKSVRDILHEEYGLTRFQTHMAVFDSKIFMAFMDYPELVMTLPPEESAESIYKEWINDKPVRKKSSKFSGW